MTFKIWLLLLTELGREDTQGHVRENENCSVESLALHLPNPPPSAIRMQTSGIFQHCDQSECFRHNLTFSDLWLTHTNSWQACDTSDRCLYQQDCEGLDTAKSTQSQDNPTMAIGSLKLNFWSNLCCRCSKITTLSTPHSYCTSLIYVSRRLSDTTNTWHITWSRMGQTAC